MAFKLEIEKNIESNGTTTAIHEPQERGPQKRKMSVWMKGLQTVAAEVLDDQHTEGETIDEVIAAARENRADLTTFRIANALVLRRMELDARNLKFDEIVGALRESTVVEHVVLSNIGGTDHLASELAAILANNTTIRSLSLESNDIRGPGADALSEMLCKNSTLEKLKLAELAKRLPSESLHKLADAVAQSRLTTCSVACHDATARERLEKALLRNMDRVREERKAARDSVVVAGVAAAPGVDPVSSAGTSAAIRSTARSTAEASSTNDRPEQLLALQRQKAKAKEKELEYLKQEMREKEREEAHAARVKQEEQEQLALLCDRQDIAELEDHENPLVQLAARKEAFAVAKANANDPLVQLAARKEAFAATKAKVKAAAAAKAAKDDERAVVVEQQQDDVQAKRAAEETGSNAAPGRLPGATLDAVATNANFAEVQAKIQLVVDQVEPAETSRLITGLGIQRDTATVSTSSKSPVTSTSTSHQVEATFGVDDADDDDALMAELEAELNGEELSSADMSVLLGDDHVRGSATAPKQDQVVLDKHAGVVEATPKVYKQADACSPKLKPAPEPKRVSESESEPELKLEVQVELAVLAEPKTAFVRPSFALNEASVSDEQPTVETALETRRRLRGAARAAAAATSTSPGSESPTATSSGAREERRRARKRKDEERERKMKEEEVRIEE
jgi:hypothetical protein